ncbi:conserved hypothetical protein [Trichinella spiralis]|uniref:hypothetical protein n=1 Tax=Trichinella spiralis TaxID=6334 RepID=UPI0001EFDBB2|nr:conserved hypothetical protein [Trichinella spiralis]
MITSIALHTRRTLLGSQQSEEKISLFPILFRLLPPLRIGRRTRYLIGSLCRCLIGFPFYAIDVHQNYSSNESVSSPLRKVLEYQQQRV